MTHAQEFLKQTAKITEMIDHSCVERMVISLSELRDQGGRLFIIGVGGSAANASHAVNDFRKLCGIEAYTPTDNVSELSARTNDEGWETVFVAWLRTSNANEKDGVFVFSVGGGDVVRNISPNIVAALDEAKIRGLKIFGVVGREGGYTKMVGDIVIVVPTVYSARITPHAESFQAVVWHCLVSHPALAVMEPKWEGLEGNRRGA